MRISVRRFDQALLALAYRDHAAALCRIDTMASCTSAADGSDPGAECAASGARGESIGTP